MNMEISYSRALDQRAYLLNILQEIADATICYETQRKAQNAIDKIHSES